MDKKLKKKIDIELKHNRLWRVKELYSSAIKYHEYDQELYFEYAKILFKFGDYMESGKYFLLTDTNEEKYVETINYLLEDIIKIFSITCQGNLEK